ncbi:MAG TPA: peptide ABC transporter substrate-binding protein [Candidatus Tectomicrobia bacterium]
MSIDETTLRTWVQRVVNRPAERRAFLRYMLGVGMSGPLLGNLLASYKPVQAQTKPPAAFVPTRRGGGGKLRLLWWQAPTILNAHLSSGTKDLDASRVVCEPLAAFDPEANFVPILAADIPSFDNGGLAQDGTSVTWRLKQGVVWHDGEPFTADDVIFTWEYAADAATGATTIGSYANIDHIDKLNAHTVKVVFKEPTAFWYDAFFGMRGQVLPKHLLARYKGQEARNAPYNLKPVGTGPYKIIAFKPGDVALYGINPQYHVSHRPFFDTVELKGGGDATSAARAVLQTGEFDFAWNLQVEHSVLSGLERSGKGNVLVTHGSDVEHILVNFTDPWTEVDGERSSLKKAHPFQTDPLIRQAYALAVDRRTIAEQLYGTAGEPTSNFLVAPPRYTSSNTTWEFAPRKAAALLEQAGWQRGNDGVRVKNGQRLKIVYQTSVNPIRQKTQAIVKKALEDIGFEVELKAVNAGVYFASDPGNPDTYSHFYTDIQMYTTGPGSPDPQEHMNKFTSWQIAQKANNWSGRNIMRWSHAAYDRLWKEAAAALDPVKRTALYIAMNDMVVKHNVVVPVTWRHRVSATHRKLRGMELTAWDSNLWHLAYWYREA